MFLASQAKPLADAYYPKMPTNWPDKLVYLELKTLFLFTTDLRLQKGPLQNNKVCSLGQQGTRLIFLIYNNFLETISVFLGE